MEHLLLMFLDHTQRRSTVGRTPLDESSARRRDFYLTTHDTHNRQISMPPVGFEPTISAGERPQAAHLLRSYFSVVMHTSNIEAAGNSESITPCKIIIQNIRKSEGPKSSHRNQRTTFTSRNNEHSCNA
jgi:hypothetical protein